MKPNPAMQHPDLFDQPVALARSTDPATSYEAADKVESSGRAPRQRWRCLECLRRHPGATAAEIADYIGMERHMPSRRLPELRVAGDVYNGKARICSVTKNRSMTWWVTV